jgi:hypothetical protein
LLLQGLKIAVQVAAHYDVDDVADQVVLALAKFTSSLSPAVMRPRAVFGRDFKACAATESLFSVVNRWACCAGRHRVGQARRFQPYCSRSSIWAGAGHPSWLPRCQL